VCVEQGIVGWCPMSIKLSLLLPIANKYMDITKYALSSELRYFINGGGDLDEFQIHENRIKTRNC
jgi:hypothetical protein